MPPEQTLEGKTALVVGAGEGLAKVIAVDLTQRGATVAVLDISDAGSAGMADAARIEQALAGLRASLERIDILVDVVGETAAGGPSPADAGAAGELSGHVALSRAMVNEMAARGSGRIVFVPVSAATADGPQATVAVAAAKGGIVGVARALAVEFAPSNITVNCVGPGPTDLPGQQPWAARNPEVVSGLMERIPMRRMAAPEDVAAAVAFLASDRAAYITGIVLGVNGGATGEI